MNTVDSRKANKKVLETGRLFPLGPIVPDTPPHQGKSDKLTKENKNGSFK
jgi:hypothetical protein